MQENVLADCLLRNSTRVSHPIYKELALVLLGVGSISCLAQVALPLPFTPIPVTGQTLAVLLMGATYGSWRALHTTAVYLGLGAVGLPIFAKASAGTAVLLGPTGGYLVGFLLAAFVMGAVAERGYLRRFNSSVPLFLTGHACIFLCGMSWLGFFVGYDNVVAMGLLPFIPGLIVKTVIAGALLPALYKVVKS